MNTIRKIILYSAAIILLICLGISTVCGILLIINACNDVEEFLNSYKNVQTIAAVFSIGGVVFSSLLLWLSKRIEIEKG